MIRRLIFILFCLPVAGLCQTSITSLLFQLVDSKDARIALENEGWKTNSIVNYDEYYLDIYIEYNFSKNVKFNDGSTSMAYITIKEFDNNNKNIDLKFYNKNFYDKFREILMKSGYNELSKEIKNNTIDLTYSKDPLEINLKEKLNEFYQITILNFVNITEDTPPPPSPKDILIIEEEETTDDIFEVVEDMPLFKGCTDDRCTQIEIIKHIAKNTKYPPIAKENNITGRVFISFVVDKTGNVKNVKVLRGVDKILDAEAIRVIQALPNFQPGKQHGKVVNVQYNVPINFQLN